MMNKKTIVIGSLTGLLLFTGCAQLESLSDRVYTPELSFETNTVNTAVGPAQVIITKTNWVVSSRTKAVAELPDQIGIPFGSLITFVAMSILSIGAMVRGKKYKDATLSALDAGNQFKEELRKNKIDVNGMLKGMQKSQKKNGTFAIIRKLLDLV
jgi:uncharacterized membrane protein